MSKTSDFINFLIDATKDVEAPMNIKQLARDYKDETGASETVDCLCFRIRNVRSNIRELQEVDISSKVKLMFGLSATVDSSFLNKLREDALVEVDGKNRITKYTAKDGSLLLEGQQDLSFKRKLVWSEKKRRESGLHMSHNVESDDDEDKAVDLTAQNGIISKKTVSDDNLSQNVNRTLNKKSTFKTPTSTKKKRKNGEQGPSSSKRSARPSDPTDDSVDPDYSFDDFYDYMIHTPRVKVEKFSASIVDKEIALDDDEEEIQVISMPGLDLVAPKLEEEQVMEEPLILEPKQEPEVKQPLPQLLQFQGNSSNLPRSTPAAVQNQGYQKAAPAKPIRMKNLKKESVKPAQPKEESTTKRNALNTIHSLVLTLDLPSLKDLQKKIEAKIKKATDEPYLISGFLLALETCFFFISNSTTKPSNDEETTSVRDFLLLLKGSVITSKLNGFNGFQKKLTEKIGELSVEDKKIAIDQVKCAIEATLNIISLQI